MTINADLLELQQMAATMPPESDGSLAALETIPAIYAFLATCARQDGDDEGDAVELFCRFDGATAPAARSIAAVLKALGYRAAADRLFMIAGKRKHDLRPLK
jgi:hypothetical protein